MENKTRRNILLFDMDGTLIDSKTTIATHFVKALNQLKINHSISEEAISHHLEIPFKELLHSYQITMSEKLFNDFVNIYRHNYANDPLTGTSIFPDVNETLAYLKQNGYKFVLVTGKHIDNAELIMTKLGLHEDFDLIQGWEEKLRPKPEPDILKHALKKLSLQESQCIMIGDTYVDILAGQALKMPTIAATYGLGKLKTLKESSPDFIINSFTEIKDALEQIK